MMAESAHTPVMLAPVLGYLAPAAGGCYVDATLGAGGYAAAVAEAASCRVYGLDRDGAAVAAARQRFAGRDDIVVMHGRFGALGEHMAAAGVTGCDGIVFDFGVASPQLDDPQRGFSFRHDGPLDMRMDPSEGPTAADIVNSLGERALADIFFQLGEEKRSRAVARKIVAARQQKPITTTGELATIVRRTVPPAKDGLDPATRTFQALRIYVNDELGEIDRGLVAAEALLRPGGRLVAVAFHSLEDRRVKQFLRRRSNPAANRPRPARDPAATTDPGAPPAPSFHLLTRKPVRPDASEADSNPRARSARLRAGERTAAAPLPAEEAA